MKTTPSDVISVLLVDDHELVRKGVRAFFDAQPDVKVVAEASHGKEAVSLAEVHQPDVVLMDLLMPGMDGVDTTRAVKVVSPSSRVVVLSSHQDDAYIFSALRAGALGYILKTVRSEELVAAVRRAAAGEPTLHPSVALKLMEDVRDDEQDGVTDLTPRELEVLKLIAEGLSNAGIADALGVAEKTVKGHVGNVLSKLHVHDRTQAAVYAWREGVVRRGGDEP